MAVVAVVVVVVVGVVVVVVGVVVVVPPQTSRVNAPLRSLYNQHLESPVDQSL